MKANETTTLKGATANINHLALDTKNLQKLGVAFTNKS
ncbi:hypothetical protein HPSSW114_0203 [Glaesserella parasuis SW114]|nr:hypothetical protein HPSSW114_0203 [Glaesserella parasuis SW114]